MNRMSLGGRLLLASTVLLPVFLVLTGFGLDRGFRRAMRAGELEQLKLQSYLVLGAAELEDGRIVLPDNLSEPRYAQLGSGLYGRIVDRSGTVSWRSPSAAILPMADTGTILDPGQSAFGDVDLDGTPLFYYRYGFAWVAEEGGDVIFELTVWHHQLPYRAQLAGFRRSLVGWLGLVALLLVALQLVVLRWGLRPLHRLADDLARVEQGEVSQLGGAYPSEVRGIARNLDHLLASEQGRRERYRDTLADLAHSLKTPLAVLRGALETGADRDVLGEQLGEQLDRMEEIVAHQLSRAVRRGERPVGGSTSVESVTRRLAAALEKVYHDKGVRIELDVASGLRFRGDEGDLMEMVGNLLDNACKYGRRRVGLEAGAGVDGLCIAISDDGPGIPTERRSDILQRGSRVDVAQPGHGLGLAVAMDIAASYGGRIEIGQSVLGGARFEVWVPGGSATANR